MPVKPRKEARIGRGWTSTFALTLGIALALLLTGCLSPAIPENGRARMSAQ